MVLGKFSTLSSFIHICMTVCLCTTYVLCPHRPEEGTGSPETSQPCECWGQNPGPLEKVSALNCCTLSPAPLYLRSSISKSVSVPCCLLIILGETQICIMIMTRSFFLVKTYGSGLEMTPGVKAYCSWRTPFQLQEDLPPLASADTCTHMHIMKNNILRKFMFEYY